MRACWSERDRRGCRPRRCAWTARWWICTPTSWARNPAVGRRFRGLRRLGRWARRKDDPDREPLSAAWALRGAPPVGGGGLHARTWRMRIDGLPPARRTPPGTAARGAPPRAGVAACAASRGVVPGSAHGPVRSSSARTGASGSARVKWWSRIRNPTFPRCGTGSTGSSGRQTCACRPRSRIRTRRSRRCRGSRCRPGCWNPCAGRPLSGCWPPQASGPRASALSGMIVHAEVACVPVLGSGVLDVGRAVRGSGGRGAV